MRRWVAGWRLVGAGAVAAVLLAGCGSGTVDETTRDDGGEIVSEGELGAFALQVGDCFNDPSIVGELDEESVVESVQAVPCTEPHTGEVISVDAAFFENDPELPAADVIETRAGAACIADLVAYTGQAYEESPFEVVFLTPTPESWDLRGDRGLVCVGTTLSADTGLPVQSESSMRQT